jgi:hypothetical protein
MCGALPSLAAALNEDDFLVVDRARRAVFQVDPLTGDRIVISGCADVSCSTIVGGGDAFGAPSGLARGATQDLNAPFYVTDTINDSLVRIDPTTGQRTVVSSQFVGTGTPFVSPVSVAVKANGDLLFVDEDRLALIEVNALTGNRTVISGCLDAECNTSVGAGAEMFSAPHDLVIDISGNALVLDSALDAVFQVDVSTGARSQISSWAAVGVPSLAAIENIVLDFADDGVVFSIDAMTGDRVVVSSSARGRGFDFLGPSILAIASVSAPIPEPSTALLIGLGSALGSKRRRGPARRATRQIRA